MFVLDQRKLPHEEIWEECTTAHEVSRTILEMKVRGAPAIGAAAAYGIAVEAHRNTDKSLPEMQGIITNSMNDLASTRPTAVNLFWAIERMRNVMSGFQGEPSQLAQRLVHEAENIASEDVQTNRRIGANGASLFQNGTRILTHCNTGSLATVEYGTALGVIRSLFEQGKLSHVWVDETRPYLQGARLTAFELATENIPHTLITDNMAAHFMKQGEVDAVIVGADRIAANGDTANKIGTYGLAVLCKHHGIPFYVAAPVSTFDLQISSGAQIPIEERSSEEVTSIGTYRIAPATSSARHPAFDVTPAELITGIITEKGIIHHPTTRSVQATILE